MKKTSYCKCFPELDDKELDEKYALISHAIQLENKPEAKNYIDILKKNSQDDFLKIIACKDRKSAKEALSDWITSAFDCSAKAAQN